MGGGSSQPTSSQCPRRRHKLSQRNSSRKKSASSTADPTAGTGERIGLLLRACDQASMRASAEDISSTYGGLWNVPRHGRLPITKTLSRNVFFTCRPTLDRHLADAYGREPMASIALPEFWRAFCLQLACSANCAVRIVSPGPKARVCVCSRLAS